MNIRLHSISSFRTVSDIFVTFLYGASIEVIIEQATGPKPIAVRLSIIVLLLIIFVFSDWLGRVRLPWLLPPQDEINIVSQLLKSLLELSCLYFLVLAWLGIVDEQISGNFQPNSMNPRLAFALFLFANFLWNMLLLKAMQEIDWLYLALIGINGSALDSPKLEHYANRFFQFQKILQTWESRRTGSGTSSVISNIFVGLPSAIIESFVRACTQIVALHIAWVSLVSGTIILIGDSVFQRDPVGLKTVENTQWLNYISTIIFLLIFFLTIPIIIFLKKRSSYGLKRLISFIKLKFELLINNKLMFRDALLDIKSKRRTLLNQILFFCLLNFVRLISLCSFFVLAIAFSSYLSEVISNLMYKILLVFAAPSVFFLIAVYAGSIKPLKRFFLWIGGCLGAMMLLLLYLTIDSGTLILIIGAQQVIVTAFLQYAASAATTKLGICPANVRLLPGEIKQFYITFNGEVNMDADVIWETSEGTIMSNGTYIAPKECGLFQISVRLATDKNRIATIPVRVDNLEAISKIASEQNEQTAQ